ILIGEYRYIDIQGITVLNSLSIFDNNITGLGHNIKGAKIKGKGEYPKCLECPDEEFRVKTLFIDPQRSYIPMALMLRSVSPTQIKAKLYRNGKPFMANQPENAPIEIRIPS
ncbi:DUF6705 family protein, partial [Flavobacterium suncheonense]